MDADERRSRLNELSEKAIGCCYAVANALGAGFPRPEEEVKRRWTRMNADSEFIHDYADLEAGLPEVDQQAQLQAGCLKVVHALSEVHVI